MFSPLLDGVEYNVSGKLVPKPETNHTEIVCDIGVSRIIIRFQT